VIPVYQIEAIVDRCIALSCKDLLQFGSHYIWIDINTCPEFDSYDALVNEHAESIDDSAA
jgi:hypothetical protein